MTICGGADVEKEMRVSKAMYLDPWSGIGGDMLVAALLDCDYPEGRLEKVLRECIGKLPIGPVELRIERVVEWGVACTRFSVIEKEPAPLRHLEDMERILENAPLSDWVRDRALSAVRRLAATEASVHGCEISEVHFHEVGAVDTLVDIVGALVLVEALGVTQAYVGTIPVGGGTVQIAHGRMGVPAPATARLLAGYQVVGGPEARELTTPTGALLVRELGCRQEPLPPLHLERVGYGAGAMKLESGPNVLRVLLGSVGDMSLSGTVVELATTLDDVSPQVIGHAVDQLRQAGALDVWVTPAQMKKNRPGAVLHVLTDLAREMALTEVLFAETGTLGVRRYVTNRYVAERGFIEVEVYGHPVAVKWGKWGDKVVSLHPEYDQAAHVAFETGVPLSQVILAATSAARERLDSF
ncbi:MAG: nickel pincer cofactor biosynthesis protein LarC [Thermoleophilia bacterium]|nr:nickel pincer cofactor biosynthesis protein LarC [Thermoleophilia bacterium]